jgi:hypothetical protein
MPRNTPLQKLNLAMRLLVGMKHPTVEELLRPHGFSKKTISQGWRLLVAAGQGGAALEEDGAESADAELVAFQKAWFPIVRAVTRARLPHGESPWPSLQVQEGLRAFSSVSTFLGRLSALAESSDERERDIFATLRARGLTLRLEERARALAARSGDVIYSARFVSRPDNRAAMDALWAWYLEWQGIARQRVKNKVLLRSLGLIAEPAPKSAKNPRSDIRVLKVTSAPKGALRSSDVPRLLAPEDF